MKSLAIYGLIFSLLLSPVFAKVPERIIAGMPSITEMLYALDLGKHIVGVTTNCNYPPIAKKKEKVGGYFLNLEKVVALKPDLIIMLEDAQKRDIKRFKAFGLPVYSINPHTVNDVMESMLMLGDITGNRGKAKKVVSELRWKIKKVSDRTHSFKPKLTDVLSLWNPNTDKRKALVIVGLNPLVVAGRNTFIDDVLKYAGVENVAANTNAAYPQYSFEKLVSDNPQYIIILNGLVARETLEKDRHWQSLEAVRKKRIMCIDADILTRPGPRVTQAIEQIAQFIY